VRAQALAQVADGRVPQLLEGRQRRAAVGENSWDDDVIKSFVDRNGGLCYPWNG
jgi:hypothetical protein